MPHLKSAAYQSATQWLYHRIDYERLARPGTHYRFTLDRMRDLVDRLGHGRYLAPGKESESTATNLASPTTEPANARILHIAGTKGKGSVATMAATMLTSAGHRVGLYTSPHLVDLEERFRVDGIPAAEEEMVDLIDSMRPIVQSMSEDEIGPPSFFELTTAIAIEHFHRNACEFWVLETGLGGRLDSTNVFQSDVTVVTSIGLDHQHVLGDTVELIAKEKAGIFKRGVPAISGVNQPPACEVIRQSAAQTKAPLIELGRDFFVEHGSDSSQWGSSFEWIRPDPVATRVGVTLLLEGRHQVDNAALAIAAVDRLAGMPAQASLRALAKLQIDARLERFTLPGGTRVILDAAHNPDSIAALARTLEARFSNRRLVGVFGTSVDKDAAVMLASLHGCLDHIVLTRYHGNPRYVPVPELAKLARAFKLARALKLARAFKLARALKPGDDSSSLWYSQKEDPIAATQSALQMAGEDGVVVVCGSFFLAAEVRPWLAGQSMSSFEKSSDASPT